ncbi:MAG: hypothetical protein GDA49_14090 [Rhodospirillales bacterium]|nr:hypothetical protein [Rhodospirillales bacterium]
MDIVAIVDHDGPTLGHCPVVTGQLKYPGFESQRAVVKLRKDEGLSCQPFAKALNPQSLEDVATRSHWNTRAEASRRRAR